MSKYIFSILIPHRHYPPPTHPPTKKKRREKIEQGRGEKAWFRDVLWFNMVSLSMLPGRRSIVCWELFSRGVGNVGIISRTRQARDSYSNFPPIISVRSQKAPTEKCHLVLSEFQPEQNSTDPYSVRARALNRTHGRHVGALDRKLQRPDIAYYSITHNYYIL